MATVVTVAALLVALVAVGLALSLLFLGQRWVVTPGDSLGEPRVEYRPFPAALLPLAAALLVLAGLCWQRALAWAGLLFLALFGGLFVFSEGLPFLAAAVLLVPLLTALHVLRRTPG